jgi:fumarate reductase subunit D
MLSKTGRLTLVNSVLSSVVIYYMSVFPMFKWAIKRIDKTCRNFLWKGSEDAVAATVLLTGREFKDQSRWAGLECLT